MTETQIIAQHTPRDLSTKISLCLAQAAALVAIERCRSKWDKVHDVYFIRSVTGGPIKIGASVTTTKRMADFQTNCPFKLEIIGLIPQGGIGLERKIQKRFAQHRLHGEWFAPAQEILDFIKGLSNE